MNNLKEGVVFESMGVGNRNKFFVHGTPKPQPRQRHSVRKRSGRSFVHNYTPEKHPVNIWKKIVAYTAKQYITTPLKGPIRLELLFSLQRPKSVRRQYHTVKPDVDNLAKAVMDALTASHIFEDDRFVTELFVKKEYGEKVGVMIEIEEVIRFRTLL